MERRRQAKRRQKMIIGVVVAVAVVLLAVVIALTLGGKGEVNYSIFLPAGDRLVASMNAEAASFEDGEYEPEITRIIYYHNGKEITKVEVYFEYESEDEAKKANENITLAGKEWATGKSLRGRFIVFDVASEQYNGLSVEQMRRTLEDMRAAGTLLEEDEETSIEENLTEAGQT